MVDCKKCVDYKKGVACSWCNNGSRFKRITNADAIRSMTDEELADFLYCIEAYCEDGEYKKYIEEVTLSDNMHDILQWLQSEAE